MKTSKICNGILHPKGIELPITMFYTHHDNRDNKIYHSTICKECENERNKTGNYKDLRTKAQHKYNLTHNKKRALHQKNIRIQLQNNYIKNALQYGLGINRESITPEQIELKRAQLTLYREIKKL
jgi:hypothetical protein